MKGQDDIFNVSNYRQSLVKEHTFDTRKEVQSMSQSQSPTKNDSKINQSSMCICQSSMMKEKSSSLLGLQKKYELKQSVSPAPRPKTIEIPSGQINRQGDIKVFQYQSPISKSGLSDCHSQNSLLSVANHFTVMGRSRSQKQIQIRQTRSQRIRQTAGFRKGNFFGNAFSTPISDAEFLKRKQE